MSQPDFVEQFAEAFVREYDASQPGDSAPEKWESLRDTMHRTALATFGKKTSKCYDWFEAKSTERTPFIESKHAALAEYKRFHSEKNLQIFGAARSKVQQTVRRCANVTGNIRWIYGGIKKALGPAQTKTAPLQILQRGSNHGQRPTDGEMGGTLLRPLL